MKVKEFFDEMRAAVDDEIKYLKRTANGDTHLVDISDYEINLNINIDSPTSETWFIETLTEYGCYYDKNRRAVVLSNFKSGHRKRLTLEGLFKILSGAKDTDNMIFKIYIKTGPRAKDYIPLEIKGKCRYELLKIDGGFVSILIETNKSKLVDA